MCVMVPKRPFHGDGGDGSGIPAQEAKRFKSAVRDVLGMLSLNDLASKMEPFLRDVVQDEVEKAFRRFFQQSSSSHHQGNYSRPPFNQAGASRRRGLLLHFDSKLPSTIFTSGKVEAKDGSPIKITLLNDTSGNVVTSGSLSSMKIEIVVLDGDFGPDDQDDWSEDEFTANVIREREGRRPLVAGELTITLRNGVGQIGDIFFTDNSSWQRSRRFRLGVRPLHQISGVREARTEAFMVKDHRGELYKKHHPPALDDEVWRLERIAKDGAFHRRLATRGVHTVKDFLQLYIRDQAALREMLGGGISNRMWEIIIGHAIKCTLDDGKFYSFYEAGERVGLLFDSIYRVVGVTFDGQNYEQLDNLIPRQKVLVENIKRQAYRNVSSFVLVDTNFVSRPLTGLQPEPFQSTNPGLQQVGFPASNQDQPEMLLDFNNSSSSTSHVYEGESSSQLEVSVGQTSHPMQAFPPGLRQSFKFLDDFHLPGYITSSQWPLVSAEDFSEVQTPSSSWPTSKPYGQGNAFTFTSSNERELGIISSLPGFGIHMSRIGRRKAGWSKIRAALKWGSVRRDVANKRMWQSFCMY